MEPRIVEKDAFTVIGVESTEAHETDDFETPWNDFMSHHGEVKPHSTDGAYYGVSYGEGGDMRYLAGMAVAGVAQVPEGLTMREVPGGRYAVFECTVATIHDAYDHIFGEWLPSSGYEHDARPDFERYGPDTATGEDPVLIHVPVVR
ncbi:MAG: GyrI-like domain-containing protein [Armatimonadota bacterium]|jgi:AraC family transcriptional regulator